MGLVQCVPAKSVVLAGLSPTRRPRRILDLGCGDGVLTAKLGEQGCTVVGIDSSPEMVAAARAVFLDRVGITDRVLPQEGLRSRYEAGYGMFRSLYQALRPLFREATPFT